MLKKSNQWYFGTTAYIGTDVDSGLAHTVRCTSGHVNDIAEAGTLLLGQETAFGDAGYQGVERRPDAGVDGTGHVGMRTGKRNELEDQAEKLKASIREKLSTAFG